MKKLTSKLLCVVIAVLLLFSGCTPVIENVTTTTEVTTSTTKETTTQDVTEEVTISNEVSQLANDTANAIDNGKDLDTQVIIEGSAKDEDTVENEEALEPDAQIEIENASYDGTNTGNGLKLLGKYTGISYYSQRDPRWANKLYTSTGNKSQTMKSSACGPTSAAMIVSSSKGTILPTTMAQLFVDNGYRTANNGTAWSVWAFIADYFDFDEYHSTSSYNTMINYLKTDKNKDGISDYFVVASCNPGLFTTGGHYIVLIQFNGKIVVFDPYLYAGKFNTPSRRAAGVSVSGNSAYVTESSFKKYGNTKHFWIYSNDSKDAIKDQNKNNNSSSSTITVNYTRYISTSSSPLNVRKSANTSSAVKTTLKKGTKVNVTKINGSWAYINSPTTGWVSAQYLSASPVTSTSSSNNSTRYSTKVGSIYKLKNATILYSKGNLSGAKYNYKAKTKIKVISHYSTTVDYIYVPATKRYAYCSVKAYSSGGTSSSTSQPTKHRTTVNKHYRLKSNTTLYSKGNLSGTRYNYKSKTEIVVLSHYSTTVDKIKVVKTGRVAYVKVSAFI